MPVYRGVRERGIATVLKDDAPLDLARSLRVRGHSPTGFEWGYGGSGPAQLALALLLEEASPAAVAEVLYQKFKWDVVSALPVRGWRLTSETIQAWIKCALADDLGDVGLRALCMGEDLGEDLGDVADLGDQVADEPTVIEAGDLGDVLPPGTRIAE